jgi:4-oxalocrotonate tautomerase
MPYINVKLVKQQVTNDQKEILINGLIDVVVNIMGRNPNYTVVTLDEIDHSNWFIGKKSIDTLKRDKLCYIEIKISKGTSNPEQMAEVIKAGKELVSRVLGSNDETNYFVINELNPDSWGFNGISMTIRNKMES